MMLNIHGFGHPRAREVPDAELAAAFWASSWGLQTRLTGQEPSGGLLAYLTAPAAQGGLQASWTDRAGLHAVRDLVIETKPGEGHG